MAHSVSVQFFGESRSFPGGETPFGETVSAERADVLILAGKDAGRALAGVNAAGKAAVLVELGTECLGVYTGEHRGEEGSNVLGFARFRLGTREPTNLVELVKQPRTEPTATQAAKELFEAAGLQTAVCNDAVGRILDRLIRPYYNMALRALDDGLANADDLDLTVRLGLGFQEGPIALLESSGLAEHYEVSRALYEADGDPALFPPRRAYVAKAAQGRAGP
jgi:3-hydroxybutyryl-CoA dehydrogenase